MIKEDEAFKIITEFAKKLFSSPLVDINKKIRIERTEDREFLINGKPSLYKQIINGK